MFYDFFLKNIIIFILLFSFASMLVCFELYQFFRSKNIVTVVEALKLINDDKAIIIDLRAPKDFKSCHIINSINLPMTELEKNIFLIKKYQSKVIILIYYNNRMLKNILYLTQTLDNFDIKYFKNGLKEWIDHGMPVKHSD
ncbi:MAG TPA: rhodanese-like domain-containing protein [Candidatus Azoamicus sp. OHIO2]